VPKQNELRHKSQLKIFGQAEARSRALVSSTAAVSAMTTAMPSTAASTMTAAASATSATTTTGTSTAPAAISATWAVTARTIAAGLRSTFAIEIRLLRIIRKIPATLNHQRSRRNRLATFGLSRRRSSFPAAHLRALFFQNRFARKSDSVPFHRQHLH
jgi:hypothetical protein